MYLLERQLEGEEKEYYAKKDIMFQTTYDKNEALIFDTNDIAQEFLDSRSELDDFSIGKV